MGPCGHAWRPRVDHRRAAGDPAVPHVARLEVERMCDLVIRRVHEHGDGGQRGGHGAMHDARVIVLARGRGLVGAVLGSGTRGEADA